MFRVGDACQVVDEICVCAFLDALIENYPQEEGAGGEGMNLTPVAKSSPMRTYHNNNSIKVCEFKAMRLTEREQQCKKSRGKLLT